MSSRVKDKDSFLKKVLQKSFKREPWTDPIVECTDKVGCRIDVVYLADVFRLRDEIEREANLKVQRIDDKTVELGADSLG